MESFEQAFRTAASTSDLEQVAAAQQQLPSEWQRVPPSLQTMALLEPAPSHLTRPVGDEQTALGDSVMEYLMSGALQIDEQAIQSMRETTPAALGAVRHGFVTTGGYSQMDAQAIISSPRQLIQYLPRALVIGLLAPFPWQWFDARGSTGCMRTFSGVEVVLVYLLLYGLARGLRTAVVKPHRADRLLLLAFVVFAGCSISVVVANLGTLFRLRLQFLLPLLIIVAAGQPLNLLELVRSRWHAVKLRSLDSPTSEVRSV
jgi:hypothetical protein